ncbi:MAG: DUF4105 domain-containing protein [Bdellovibrio sp.]
MYERQRHKDIFQRIFLFIFSVTGLLCSVSAAALNLELKAHSGLPKETEARMNAFLREAEAKLPPSLKSRLDKTIKISVAPMTERAQSRSSEVILNKNIVAALQPRARGMTTVVHRTPYEEALGALLHEVGHHYDSSRLRDYPQKSLREYCLESLAQSSTATQAVPAECHWHKHSRNISDNPQFLYALNWTAKKEAEAKSSRSPDPQELKSSEEAFGVNFEFFLLDPEYKCKRPTAYAFLEKHFEFSPHKDLRCEQANFVTTTIFNDVGAYYHSEIIDARRVYEVHYLLAGDGQDMSSRWGHSMLRLVICSPLRTKVGPECLEDLAYHRVLSYRAGVTDLALSPWKGLTGQYPSQIFIMPFLNVQEEYNKLELRELLSYPLSLSEKERTDLVQRAIEQYWSYRGEYYFISNNCASETKNLLAHVQPNNLKFIETPVSTPKDLLRALLRSGYSRELNPEEMKSRFYYWPSFHNSYMAKLKNLNQITGSQFDSVEGLIAQPASAFQELLRRTQAEGKGVSDFHSLLSLKVDRMKRRQAYMAMEYERKGDSTKYIDKLVVRGKVGETYIVDHYSDSYGLPKNSKVIKVQEALQAKARRISEEERNKELTDMKKYISSLSLHLMGPEFVRELETSKTLAKEAAEFIVYSNTKNKFSRTNQQRR